MRDRSYQWLKDATSCSLISDKSAEKLEGGNLNYGHFSLGWVLYYGEDIHLDFSVINWSLEPLFMIDRSYQWLKDATSFGLISDKSAEIPGSEYWKKLPILHTKSAIFAFLLPSCSYAN